MAKGTPNPSLDRDRLALEILSSPPNKASILTSQFIPFLEMQSRPRHALIVREPVAIISTAGIQMIPD
jgi:hypothetical protein